MKRIFNTLTILSSILLMSSTTFGGRDVKNTTNKENVTLNKDKGSSASKPEQPTQGYVVYLERDRTPNDETLEKMSKLPNLLVDYKWDKYNPKEFERIAGKLTNIRGLDLVGAGVDDAGLKPVTKLINLRNLILADNPITNAGLVHLKDLTNLEYLNLSLAKSINNEGLPNIAGLTSLKTLMLSGNPDISDSGLVHFHGLTNLDVLNLRGTKVTKEGADQLQVHLPKTKILYG